MRPSALLSSYSKIHFHCQPSLIVNDDNGTREYAHVSRSQAWGAIFSCAVGLGVFTPVSTFASRKNLLLAGRWRYRRNVRKKAFCSNGFIFYPCLQTSECAHRDSLLSFHAFSQCSQTPLQMTVSESSTLMSCNHVQNDDLMMTLRNLPRGS